MMMVIKLCILGGANVYGSNLSGLGSVKLNMVLQLTAQSMKMQFDDLR